MNLGCGITNCSCVYLGPASTKCFANMISSDPYKPHEQSYDCTHFTDGKKERLKDPPKVTQLVSVVTLVNQELECLICCQAP